MANSVILALFILLLCWLMSRDMTYSGVLWSLVVGFWVIVTSVPVLFGILCRLRDCPMSEEISQSGFFMVVGFGFLLRLLLYFSVYCVGYVIVRCHRKYHGLGFLWLMVWDFCCVGCRAVLSLSVQCCA